MSHPLDRNLSLVRATLPFTSRSTRGSYLFNGTDSLARPLMDVSLAWCCSEQECPKSFFCIEYLRNNAAHVFDELLIDRG